MKSVIVTPATTLPVSVSEVKAAGKIEIADEEGLLDRWIRAATELAQAKTRRQLINATWRTYHDSFYCSEKFSRVPLGRGPLVSVTSAEYIDEAGATQTVSTALYAVDSVSLVPALELLYGQVWPITQVGRTNAVWVTYVAGYGVNPGDVPEPIRQWVIRTTLALSGFREPASERAVAMLPHDFADGLLDPYTVQTL